LTFRGEYQPWEAHPVDEFPPDEEDDHYDLPEDDVIVKQEANEAMKDAATPGAGDLPPEYQAVHAAGYYKDALLQQVMESSKADEDRAFPDI
jgi:hypothetical protein